MKYCAIFLVLLSTSFILQAQDQQTSQPAITYKSAPDAEQRTGPRSVSGTGTLRRHIEGERGFQVHQRVAHLVQL